MLFVGVVLFSCITRLVAVEVCQSNEERGTCQLLSKCSRTQPLVKPEQSNICGYEGEEPIICCPLYIHFVSPFLAHLMKGPEPIQSKSLSEIKCQLFYPRPLKPIIIIGGTKSLAKEFPHMAIIGFGGENDKKWNCGGSLISKNFVLTVAHCLGSEELGPAKWVRLGDLDLSTENDVAEPQDFSIKRSIAHHAFKPPSRYNDIALLELDRPVRASVFVSPACLHTQNNLEENPMTATGWGKMEHNGDSSSHLLKINLDHVEIEKCRKSYTYVSKRLLPDGILEDTQICAGGIIGRDTCQGDSGGPLQVLNFERSFTISVHTLIGVTSFGKACGLSFSPGVYTKVLPYVPWIESVVWPNETWENYKDERLGIAI
ncbi:hypothetical protein JTB14_003104 [Gonioctena quinquepunctata]|nr:hypothetical protein JTB14_003104 [Gonioctena quinquepunctata]